jgi:hypothetical protein
MMLPHPATSAVALLLVVVALADTNIAPVLIPAHIPHPRWSWDTIPTAFHGANRTGYFSKEAVDALAKYHMVSMEKWYTPCASQGPKQGPPSCAVEEKWRLRLHK